MSFEWNQEYYDRAPEIKIEPTIKKNKFELARENSPKFHSL